MEKEDAGDAEGNGEVLGSGRQVKVVEWEGAGLEVV